MKDETLYWNGDGWRKARILKHLREESYRNYADIIKFWSNTFPPLHLTTYESPREGVNMFTISFGDNTGGGVFLEARPHQIKMGATVGYHFEREYFLVTDNKAVAAIAALNMSMLQLDFKSWIDSLSEILEM